MSFNHLTNPDFAYLHDFIKTIPENFSTMGIVLKSDRNEIRVVNFEGVRVVIKSFERMTLANRIIYRFFRKSKAQRAYEYGKIIESKGIGTPNPIGYIEQFSSFRLEKSYFISLFVEHKTIPEAIENMVSDIEKFLIIKNLARFIFEVHSKHIFHRDLNLGNVLYEEKDNSSKFYLIDNNRMRFKRPTLHRRTKNLKIIDLPITQYVILMAEYAKSLNNSHYVVSKILNSREKRIKNKQALKAVKKFFKQIFKL